MSVAKQSVTREERQQLRDLVHRVPDGMTADEAMERRMALLRFSEPRLSFRLRIAACAGALVLGMLVPWLFLSLGG